MTKKKNLTKDTTIQEVWNDDETEKEMDEFERLLKQFIEEGCEKVEDDDDLDDDQCPDDDLLEITRRRVKDYEYEFTDEAWTKYADMLTQVYQAREPESWGNARFVANLLERIYVQHAVRCVKQQPQDKRSLLLITPEDIPAVEMPRPKTKIGF